MWNKRYQVSACLLIKDENEYLEEWLSWHIAVGVEHFYIYDNGSKVSVLSSIDERYREHCTVVDFSGEHRRTQIDAYTDCLTRFGEETEWMAFIDTDEFIRVVDGTDIRVFMAAYEQEEALAIRWAVYNADGQLKKENKPVRERFRQVVQYPAAYPQCKCIVRPECIKAMGAHFPLGHGRGFAIISENHEHVAYAADPLITCEKIAIDHYFTRSYEEWREKMARGSCDPCSIRGNEWFERMNPGLISSEEGRNSE